MRRFLFFLSSFYIGNPKNCVNIKNTKKLIKNGPCQGGGGGGDLLYLRCPISNTLPQLEQSSLHPSTVLHHRHLLQTTCYNHLRLLLHLLISRKEKKSSSNKLGTSLVEKPEGPSALQPTTKSAF